MIIKSMAHLTMLTLNSMLTAISLEDIQPISEAQDAEMLTNFLKSILPHFNSRLTLGKTGMHGTSVLATWIG